MEVKMTNSNEEKSARLVIDLENGQQALIPENYVSDSICGLSGEVSQKELAKTIIQDNYKKVLVVVPNKLENNYYNIFRKINLYKNVFTGWHMENDDQEITLKSLSELGKEDEFIMIVDK